MFYLWLGLTQTHGIGVGRNLGYQQILSLSATAPAVAAATTTTTIIIIIMFALIQCGVGQ
jgi:hypothetical protein